ncbi:chorismate-binding protein [Liquorilactobacillus capillatus]|uniref:Menaquinone-specific isochorismate synthase n=1 Tax=Liquorilactobacillus capillatus DSM 19910 TaxID=1423731 RepID=A0A0R1M280_9LACO|nr:chorismate-binding protein [Liquorilactobacillus capillatus]KRL02124.1 menaquinone-specific isochorismate synthase [Liquorilactobacillus capillatus DSM 19910]
MNQPIFCLKTKLPNIKLKKMLALMAEWQTAFIFQAPSNNTIRLAYGAVATCPFHQGQDQFDTLKNWQVDLKKRFVELTPPHPNQLALVGSFSFEQCSASKDSFWEELAQGYFFLPQYTIIKTGDKIELITCSLDAAAIKQESNAFAYQLQKVSNQALTPVSHTVSTPTANSLTTWQKKLSSVAQKTTSPRLKQVILTHSFEASSSTIFEPLAIWRQLMLIQPQTYHILLKTSVGTFISSTPERFAKFQANQLQTAAVTGNIKRGQSPTEDQELTTALFSNRQYLQEQKDVVKTLRSILQKHHLTISCSKEPQLLRNMDVQHLYTPITAKGHFELFKLLHDLHPAPILGGVPYTQALKQIQQLESESRGLFGSPLGYFKFDGTGELATGLRSALVKGKTTRLFAETTLAKEFALQNETSATQFRFQPLLQVLKGRVPSALVSHSN